MNKFLLLIAVFILIVTKNSTAQTCSPVIVDALTGECTPKKGFYGSAGSASAGAIIKVYNGLGVLQIPNAGSNYNSGTISANPDGSWIWKCNGMSSCASGANNCVAPGTYLITQTLPGMCESQPLVSCIGTTSVSTTPVISGTITPSTTTVNGTAGANATVILYKKNNITYTQIGSTSSNGAGAWSMNGLTFTGCDTLVALSSQPGYCSSSYSQVKIVTKGINTNVALSTGNTLICDDGPVSIDLSTSQTGVMYQLMYNGSPTGVTEAGTGNAIQITSGLLSGNGTAHVNAYLAASTGCAALLDDSIAFSVSNIQQPVITVSGTVNYCAKDTVILTSSYSSGNVWNTGSTTDTIKVRNSGTYSVVYTDGSGCTASSDIVITLNPQPAKPSLTGPVLTHYCYGDTVTLSTSYTPGLLYQWRRFGNNIPDADTTFYTLSSAGTYRVRVTNSHGCTAISDYYEVIAGPLKPTVIANGLTTLCSNGGSVLLSTDSIPGHSYAWRKFGNMIPGATGINFTATGAGKYSCVVTNAWGCTNASEAVNVTITPDPPVITAFSSPVICQGDSVRLDVAPLPGLNYQWRKHGSILAGATGTSYYATTEGQYRVTATDFSGCTRNSNDIYVSFSPARPVITASGSTNICQGDTVHLTAPLMPGMIYTWKKYSALVPGANSNTCAATKSGRYTCTVTDSNGCAQTSNGILVSVTGCRQPGIETASDEVTVYPNPSTGIFLIYAGSDNPHVVIRDLRGRMVQHELIHAAHHTFRVEGLTPGTYITTVTVGDKVHHLKLIRSH